MKKKIFNIVLLLAAAGPQALLAQEADAASSVDELFRPSVNLFDYYTTIYVCFAVLMVFFYLLSVVANEREGVRKFIPCVALFVLGVTSIAADAVLFKSWATGVAGLALVAAAATDFLKKRKSN